MKRTREIISEESHSVLLHGAGDGYFLKVGEPGVNSKTVFKTSSALYAK
jgi:hypothetical protein